MCFPLTNFNNTISKTLALQPGGYLLKALDFSNNFLVVERWMEDISSSHRKPSFINFKDQKSNK